MPRLWVAALAFAAGAVVGFGAGPGAAAPALVSGALLLLPRRRPLLAIAGLAVAAVGLGILASGIRAGAGATLARVAADAPRCSLSGRVLEHAGVLGTVVAADVLRCDGWSLLRGAGPVWLDGAIAAPGARIEAEGLLITVGGGGFGRARARRSPAQLHPTALRMTGAPSGHYRVADAARAGLRSAAGVLDSRRAALLRGLTVGDTSDMDPVTVERLRRAGLAHLVAVSGSNVAIVVGVVAIAASRLPARLRLALCAAALYLFVLVVGPEPSVLRAAAMGVIALLAMAAGTRADPLNALALALIAVLAARPDLVFSVGLHLSAAATLGIVLWSGRLAARFTWLPRPAALALGATLAAQAAVAPLLVAAFGELSVVGPVANLLAIPAVAPATVLGMAAAIGGALWLPAGRVAAWLAGPFVAWVLGVGDALGGAPWAAADVPRGLAWPLAAILLMAMGWPRRAADRVGAVAEFTWTLQDENGTDLRTTEPFASKDEAESWMGAEWAGLLDEGAEFVVLKGDGKDLYRMGLRAE